MSWLDYLTWPRAAISNIECDVAAVRVVGLEQKTLLSTILKEIHIMGAREDAAYTKLTADIQTVKDGWASLTAERDQYKAALEAADANAAVQVQAALDADSDVDAGKWEAADAALAELVAPAPEPEPTPEPSPVDPAPADGSGDDAA